MPEEETMSKGDWPGIPVNWENTNTPGAQKLTDEHLLLLISDIKVPSGWGLIAELCKRYQQHIFSIKRDRAKEGK